ncbi:T9SS type A sorting domain-containing protein [Polaribacter sp. L3A8]|uniref:T9SS type A sorting domain-containing protein n=1 Tax=Polaribacter sp. L3A8 TaxID=2686361 RepID=UPI00131D99A4|nr:T9SS type A sorting domain-containing protein [Polaribacter sp. L3A8]
MKHIIKKILLILLFVTIGNTIAQSDKSNFVSAESVKIKGLKFNKQQLYKKTPKNSFIEYLPETGINHTETAFVSISEKLVVNKNIKDFLSVVYYQREHKVASVVATKTEGAVYNHYKEICNRLNGASLDSISTVLVKEHQVIKSKIHNVSGKVEYTLSFSIKVDTNDNELFSFWNIDQYPTGDYQNYLIWGSSYAQVYAIANYVIEQYALKGGLKSKVIENVLPNVFVKTGSYSNGIVHLNLINRTQEKAVNFVGNIADTEVSEHVKAANTFSLSGDYNEVLSIETGVLFDIGFYLETASSNQKDALYLADGPWGLDYLKEYAMVSNFEIKTFEREFKEAVYEVERSVKAVGEVKGNINLFRHLLPENKTLNVVKYDFLNFNIRNNEPVEIILMSGEDRAWENRLRYTIPANSKEKRYSVSFSDFVDHLGNKAVITDIKTIVFSIIGDYTNYKPFNFDINQIAFTTNSTLSTDDVIVKNNNKLKNYPNPFTSSTTILLPTATNDIQIKVFDVMGRVVDIQKISSRSSFTKVQYNAPQLKKGVYKYSLIDDTKSQHSGTFIVN